MSATAGLMEGLPGAEYGAPMAAPPPKAPMKAPMKAPIGMAAKPVPGKPMPTQKKQATTLKRAIAPPTKKPVPPQGVTPQAQGMSAQQVEAMLNQALPGISSALTMKGSQIPSQIGTISRTILAPLVDSLDQINASLGTIAAVAEPLTTYLNAQNGQGGGRRRTRHRRGRRSTRRR